MKIYLRALRKNCVQIRSFFWSVFSCTQTEYGDLRSKSPYSVRIQENMDQKKLRIWTLFTQRSGPNIGLLDTPVRRILSKLSLSFIFTPCSLRFM